MGTDNSQIDFQLLLSRAESAKESGDLELAAAILTEAALIDTENWDVYNELYDVAYALIGTNSAAALIVINFLQTNYADFDHLGLEYFDSPLYQRGVDLINSGDLKRGEELIRAGIKFYPQSEFFKYMLGYFLLRQERYAEGIDFLEQAIELDDYQDENDFFENIEAIAWAKFKLGRKKEALQDLLFYFTRFFDDRAPKIYLRFVRLLDDKSAIDALEKMFEKLLDMENDGFPIANKDIIMREFWREYARRYQRRGKKEEAYTFLTIAAKKKQENADVLLDIGKLFLEMDSPDKALELADQAANIAPEDARHNALRAKALVAQKDFLSGLQAAEIGLAHADKRPITMVREKKSDYLIPPDLDEIKAIQKESDARAELLLSKVDALTGLERYDEALVTLGKAQKEYPKEIIFYRYAAALLLKTGKPKEALMQLQAARKVGVKLDKPSRDLQKKIKEALENHK